MGAVLLRVVLAPPIGGPPPPNDSFGQVRPLPSPPNPRLKPVKVRPHCELPTMLCHSCVTAEHSCPSTAWRSVVGFSRLVMRLSPVPLKNPLRHVSCVTLLGLVIVCSSSAMRVFRPLAAA